MTSPSMSGRGRRDVLLALVAFAASGLPFLRELGAARGMFLCGAPDHAIAPVGLTDETYAVAFKLVLAATILFLAAAVARFSARGSFMLTLAALPLVRSSLLIGAITAVGLTAFDVCTAFHGASTDVTGSCHCWLTGLLAALGALLTIGSAAVARACKDAVRDLVRAVQSLVTWIARTHDRAHAVRIERDRLVVVEPPFTRTFGGRAPPLA